MSGPRKKPVAGLLATLLGAWGVHKFYHGSTGWGILHVIPTVAFVFFLWAEWASGVGPVIESLCGLSFFLIIASGIAGIVDGIRYFSMEDAEYDERYNITPPKPYKW